MKTLDNRIQVDEETLKQFQTDSYVTEMMNRFRKAKAKLAKSRKTAKSSDSAVFLFICFLILRYSLLSQYPQVSSHHLHSLS